MGTYGSYRTRKVYQYFSMEEKTPKGWKRKEYRIPKATLTVIAQRAKNVKKESHKRVSVKPTKIRV